jgi:hypothetical protein
LKPRRSRRAATRENFARLFRRVVLNALSAGFPTHRTAALSALATEDDCHDVLTALALGQIDLARFAKISALVLISLLHSTSAICSPSWKAEGFFKAMPLASIE